MSPLTIVLIIVGVGWILVSRLMGQLLEVKRLLVLPVVLTAIGLFRLDGAWSPTAVGFAAAGIAISVGLGLLRGRTVHLGRRADGELWMRYRASTVGLWVLNIASKIVLVPVERGIAPHAASTADAALLFSVGLGVLAETAVVLLRAMHSDGEIVWTKGENGAPHTVNPAFERLRESVNASTDRSHPAADGSRLTWPKHDW